MEKIYTIYFLLHSCQSGRGYTRVRRSATSVVDDPSISSRNSLVVLCLRHNLLWEIKDIHIYILGRSVFFIILKPLSITGSRNFWFLLVPYTLRLHNWKWMHILVFFLIRFLTDIIQSRKNNLCKILIRKVLGKPIWLPAKNTRQLLHHAGKQKWR